jgi:hypothetical protein
MVDWLAPHRHSKIAALDMARDSLEMLHLLPPRARPDGEPHDEARKPSRDR